MKTITYHRQGDYLLPDLFLPQDNDDRSIGKYGRTRFRYLKEHRRVLYTNLLTTGKLHSHLCDVEQESHKRMTLLIQQMAEAQGINEQLKSTDQMEWVRCMNNIRNATEEIVLKEIVYQ